MPEKKKNGIGLIAQISIIFVIGVALIGLIISLILYATAVDNVKNDLAEQAETSASDLEGYIKHFPANEWMLTYWYENYDELDAEYDSQYEPGSKTAQKYALLESRHPEFMPEYATGADVRALPPEDQKLYAEITYSWLLYRINQIQLDDNMDYIFCIAARRPYDKQTVLFMSTEKGGLNGGAAEQRYPVGKVIESTEEQMEALHSAAQRVPATAYDEDGKYLDYYHAIGHVDGNDLILGVTRSTRSVEDAILGQTLKLSLLNIFFMVVLALGCLSMIMSVVVLPLRRIQKTIRLYKDTKDSAGALKDLSGIRSDNELGQLAEDIAELTQEIDAYMTRIEKITSESTRIATELELANRIQAAMMPDRSHSYPDAEEFSACGRMYPAREVGGDYYDFFLIDDDHLCMYIADVSGKGVPAALFMMGSSLVLRYNIRMGKTPAQILTDMNADICTRNPEDMFVTVWLGILELSTGRLTAANAGHEYPVIKEAGGSFEAVKDRHGIMIGGMEGTVYKEYELMLRPGTTLFVYTDGLTEASDADNNMFGMDRALAELNRDRGRTAEEYVRDMKTAVDGFVKDREPFDDLTMLCVIYNGPDGSGKA